MCFGELKGTAVKCGKCNGKLVESVPRHVDVFWFHEAADGEPDAATGRVKVKYIQPHAVKCCMPKCTCEKWHPVRQSLTAVRPPVLFARDRKKYFKKSAGDALDTSSRTAGTSACSTPSPRTLPSLMGRSSCFSVSF